jgi:hypothetical protein
MSVFDKLRAKVSGPDSPDESTVRFAVTDWNMTVREAVEAGLLEAGLEVDLADDASPEGFELTARLPGKDDEDALRKAVRKWERDGLVVTDPDGGDEQEMQEG